MPAASTLQALCDYFVIGERETFSHNNEEWIMNEIVRKSPRQIKDEAYGTYIKAVNALKECINEPHAYRELTNRAMSVIAKHLDWQQVERDYHFNMLRKMR